MALIRRLYLFISLFAVLFSSCDEFGAGYTESESSLPNLKPFIKGDTVSRTLLVYLMAENDLSKFLLNDFNEIKRAAYDLNTDSRLFVFFDNSDTTSLPALYQYHAYENRLIENVVYTFEEDVCSSDTATLANVLDAIFDDYPTKSFDLVMGSHADGWVRYPAKSAPNRTIGIDNGKNTSSVTTTKTIEIEELATLLEQLPIKVDRLMFDACLMQSVEVAYALRNSANWIIASPAEIPADGAPYDSMVPEFFNTSSGVEEIMYEYKKAYDGLVNASLLSAICTSYMQELADTTRRCVEKYFSYDSANSFSDCTSYVPGEAPAYYDINSVMKKILDAPDYEQWKAVFDKAVPYMMVSNPKYDSASITVWSQKAYEWVEIGDDCGAVSAYFPQNRYLNIRYNEDFQTTEWYRAAGWDVAGW